MCTQEKEHRDGQPWALSLGLVWEKQKIKTGWVTWYLVIEALVAVSPGLKICVAKILRSLSTAHLRTKFIKWEPVVGGLPKSPVTPSTTLLASPASLSAHSFICIVF